MLIYSVHHKTYILDPHYLTIIPFKRIWDKDKSKDKELATARILYMYHMFNPHSPFKVYRNATKSVDIVKAIFPKSFQSEAFKWEPYSEDIEGSFMDEDQWLAQVWYRNHLKQTPLWAATDGFKEAIYNLTNIVKDPNSTAQQIKVASMELDELPGRMQKMREQAEMDEPNTLKTQGDKTIRKDERLPAGYRKTKISTAAPNTT